MASGAFGVVDPCEKLSPEPFQESADNAVLVTPRGFLPKRGGLSLEQVVFFLSGVVDALQRDHAKRFVQESRVLPLAGCVGQRHEHAAETKRSAVGGCGGNDWDVLEACVVAWRRRHWHLARDRRRLSRRRSWRSLCSWVEAILGSRLRCW